MYEDMSQHETENPQGGRLETEKGIHDTMEAGNGIGIDRAGPSLDEPAAKRVKLSEEEKPQRIKGKASIKKE